MALAGHQTLGNIGCLYLRTGPTDTISKSSGEVTGWTDQGANGKNLAPQGSGTRPTHATNAFGDGSGQGVLFAAGDNLESTYNPPTNCSMWVVLRSTGTAASYGHVFGGAADDWEVYRDLSSNNLRLWDGSNDWDLQTSLTTNAVARLVFIRTGTAYAFYNGSTTATRTWTGASNLPTNFAWLSSNGEGSDSSLYPLVNGTMVAGGVIERALNATDLGTLLSLMSDEATGVRFISAVTETAAAATDSATAEHDEDSVSAALTETAAAATDTMAAAVDLAAALAETAPAATDSATATVDLAAALTESAAAATDTMAAAVDLAAALAETAPAATDTMAAAVDLAAAVTESAAAATDTIGASVSTERSLAVTETAPAAADSATATVALAAAVTESAAAATDTANVRHANRTTVSVIVPTLPIEYQMAPAATDRVRVSSPTARVTRVRVVL